MSVDDRTVIITGAAGNLGKAVAHAFAGPNANLVLVGVERQGVQRAVETENERRSFAAASALRPSVNSGMRVSALGRSWTNNCAASAKLKIALSVIRSYSAGAMASSRSAESRPCAAM